MGKYLIPALLICVFAAQAQEYKAATLFDAYGPVKEIKYKNPVDQRLLLGSKYKFAPDGKYKKGFFIYNKDGYPERLGLEKHPAVQLDTNFRFVYSTENRLDSAIMDSKTKSGIETTVFTYSYTDGKLTGCNIYRSSGDMAPAKVAEIKYEDQIYDSHGNWIERKVTRTQAIDSNRPDKEESFSEKREIKYYQ